MKPYTYLIGWSQLNKWYYGVRWSKNCHPDDLWNGYYTSSKHVSRFRNMHGEPDVIKVRKIFESKEKAVLWEQRVLSTLDVKNDDKWLNHSNGYKKYNSGGGKSTQLKCGHTLNVGVSKTDIHKHRLSLSLTGRKLTKNVKNKISEGVKRRNLERGHGPALGMKHSHETRQQISSKLKGELHPFYGKTHSIETKLKMSKSKKGQPGTFLDKKHSDETKQKMRASWAARRGSK